jgi:hypothetical protein
MLLVEKGELKLEALKLKSEDTSLHFGERCCY